MATFFCSPTVCRAAENVKTQTKEMKGSLELETNIDLVNKKSSSDNTRSSSTGSVRKGIQNRREIVKDCKYCGSEHEYGKCPAFKRRCKKCNKLNHFASVCRSKPVSQVTKQNNFSSSSSDENDESSFKLLGVNANNRKDTSAQTKPRVCNNPQEEDQPFFINSVEPCRSMESDRWLTTLDTCGIPVSFMLDLAAQVNVLPKHIYRSFQKKPRLHHTKIRLTAYDGGSTPVKGKCIAWVSNGSNKSYPVRFIVVPTKSTPLLGLETCEKLNLIKRISKVGVDESYSDILTHYKDVFGDIGCLPEYCHIDIDPAVKPVVHPARRVPFALKNRLKAELNRMASLEVIEKVDHPTDWVNSIVIVEKSNGDIRICLDPKDLNRAIKREFSQLPTAEEIMSQMAGAKIFTKLDASAGYWQVKLGNESVDLLAFNTPFGRYKFKRLPFGVHCTGEVYSKLVSEIIDGLERVAHIQDDIIVWGANREEHDNNLRKVLDRIKSSGLKLNRNKCFFGIHEIKYVGQIFTDKGLCHMPVPQNPSELHRFIGMLAYLGKFIPNLSSKTSELRKLLEADGDWNWTQEHSKEFKESQQLLTKSPTLKYFDLNLPVKVSVDASKSGLGAVLLQLHDTSWCPIAYTSRALTKTEQNYSQIEKETLAVVYGTEHFNQYVYEKKFLVESDHKPLQTIFRRNINKAPPRIQWMLFRLQKFELELSFTPGRSIPVADALSRAPSSTQTPRDTFDYQVHVLMSYLPTSEAKLIEIQKATAEDPVLQDVKRYVLNGWPENKINLPKELTPYHQFRADLSVINGLLFKEDRVIIPCIMRKKIKEKLHQGHLGVEKCKARGRQTVFWLGINAEIVEMVARCSACLENQPHQQKEPLMLHESPMEPWCKVGMDLFTCKRKNYLVIVDYFSNYPEVCSLNNTHSSTIISNAKAIFARRGRLQIVVSDNGPQFSSTEFKKFATSWKFKHITPSPKHPKSNGMAESAVKTIKKLFKKAQRQNEEPYLALLAHRSAPSTNDSMSPAQKLMGRNIRTHLPDLRALANESGKRIIQVHTKFQQARRERVKYYYNRTAKNFP